MSAPNTRLPRGGALITPIRQKIGGWVELEFDAIVFRCGVTWLRVKGGFGDGQHPREDWVASLPGVSISVSDYNWDKRRNWGTCYGTFDKACAAQLRLGLRHLEQRIEETLGKLADMHVAQAQLRKAVRS